MGEGNRTVLPLPLIGHFDTYTVKWLTIHETTLSEDRIDQLRGALEKVAGYPPGRVELEVGDGTSTTVDVHERRVVELNVQIEADANPALLHTLLQRLQSSSDEIKVVGPTWGIADTLRDAGFYPDAREPGYMAVRSLKPGDVIVAENPPPLVWFKPHPIHLAS